MRRVVITGLGIVSCLGNNQKEVYQSLLNSKSGISFSEEYNLWMDINSDIYNWINTKVLLASNSEFFDLETEEAEQNVYQRTSQ